MLKQGLLKSVQSAANADLKLSGRVYLGLGKLSTRCPDLFSSDVYLLSLLLSMLEQVGTYSSDISNCIGKCFVNYTNYNRFK